MSKRSIGILIVMLAVIATAVGITIYLNRAPAAAAATQPAADAADDAVATVSIAAVKTGHVEQMSTAYGNITAEPGSIAVVSMPVESRVKVVHVAGGQNVKASDVVIDVEPSFDTKLQFLDAKRAADAADRDLAIVKQRYDIKLATTTELKQAEQTVASTKAKFDDLQKRGAGDDQKSLKAEAAGIVSKVDVQEGQLVPAGSPLVEIIGQKNVQARLGVEPGLLNTLHENQAVTLRPAEGTGDGVEATVRRITHRVNPDSRLVDVFAAPSADNPPLLLEQFIQAKWVSNTATGLVVPRDALLPEDKGFVLFVVREGKAMKRSVEVVLQNDDDAVITGGDVKAGDNVVVQGNLELDDNAAVKVAEPTTSPTTGANQ